MLALRRTYLAPALGAATFALMAVPTQALTVEVDGITTLKLSDAVAAVYADDNDGEDIINITASSLPTPDIQIELNKPITINGDPDADGSCDILVDTLGIGSSADVGVTPKTYLEITAPGAVNINNLRLHPNSDGPFTAKNSDIVLGIVCANPTDLGAEGTYTFTNVELSGSDSNNGNAYVPPDTDADLYNDTSIYKWSGKDGNNGNISNYALIQLKTGSGSGTYNTVFDNCKAALTYGTALNISCRAGTHQVLGGLYGHSARDGIHVECPGVSIKGTYENRVRILRTANLTGVNSHGIEIQSPTVIDVMEYVDIAGVNSANSLSVQNGSLIDTIRFVRAMGKNNPPGDDSRNHTVFITGDTAQINTIENSTFYANSTGGSGFVTFAIQPNVTLPISFTDCIFASDYQVAGLPETSGTLTVGAVGTGAPTFTNCALPTDGFEGESLSTVPIDGGGEWTVVNAINESPHFMLMPEDYDWSDDQGAGVVGNGAGNANVLRPSNTSYATASTAGKQLNGGAGGEPLSAIDSSIWMLMD